ncbi:MAG: phosphatase PAP2 family protein [Bacilli bacterium]|nr:phosphatase PAP2 family protein [Bacilli bacterium]
MKKKNIILSILLIIISIIYTLSVKYIDVDTIGPNNSKVGLSTINNYFHKLIGYHETLYKITSILGIFLFIIVGIYALIGIIELIKRKSLLKVDKEIIVLGAFYIVVALVFIFFEKVIINYRPVIIEGELEASYPSTHTLLTLCICISSIIINKLKYNNFKYRKYTNILTIILMLSILIGRILSGVHWISDIFGGITISLTLLTIYKTILLTIQKKN